MNNCEGIPSSGVRSNFSPGYHWILWLPIYNIYLQVSHIQSKTTGYLWDNVHLEKKHKALSMMCFYFKQWNLLILNPKKVPGSHPPTIRLIIVPKFGWLKFPKKNLQKIVDLLKTPGIFSFNGCLYGRLQGILYIDLYIFRISHRSHGTGIFTYTIKQEWFFSQVSSPVLGPFLSSSPFPRRSSKDVQLPFWTQHRVKIGEWTSCGVQ